MPGVIERRRFDLLLILTAPPHVNDTLTTVIRLTQATLDRGRTVRIWACGYNTMLTQTSLGDTKPVNLLAPERISPSASTLIRHLVADHPGRLSWVVCTACSRERGATGHIPEVRLRSETMLARTIGAAHRTVYVGGG